MQNCHFSGIHSYGKFFLAFFIVYTNLLAQNWFAQGRTNAVVSHEAIVTGAAYSHPSCLVETQAGTIIITSIAGASEGEATQVIAVRKPQGGNWSSMIEVTTIAGMFDPTIIQPSSGTRIYCFYYHDCCENQFLRTSDDDGVTWSDEIELPTGTPNNYKQNKFEASEQNPCLEMPNGDLLCNHSRRHSDYTPRGSRSWNSVIPANNYSGQEAGGDSWRAYMTPGDEGQGAILVRDPSETVDGHYKNISVVLRCQFRCTNDQAKFIHSDDGGENWAGPFEFDVIEEIGSERIGFTRACPCAVSLDINGGPLLGWHVIGGGGDLLEADDGCNRQRCERGVIRMFIANNAMLTSDPVELTEVLELTDLSGGDEQADPTIIQASDRMLHLAWTGRGSEAIRYAIINPDVLVGDVGVQSEKKKASNVISNAIINSSLENNMLLLSLNFEQAGQSKIRIFNSMGRQILSKSISVYSSGLQTISIPQALFLGIGVFIITVESEEGVKVRQQISVL